MKTVKRNSKGIITHTTKDGIKWDKVNNIYNKAQHTAGEWKILFGNYIHFATINKDAMTRICEINITEDSPQIDEARANAKLIAAAPELLKALENVLQFNCLIPDTTVRREVLYQIHQVIKKATE
jgi:hypothetical protein